MVDQPSVLDASAFVCAARLARERARQQSLLTAAQALDDLHRSREAFRGGSDAPQAADRDADRLEHLADRLFDWAGALQRDLDRLEIARDQTLQRGALRIRVQPIADARALALNLAEGLCENVLSGPAGMVLRTAIILAAERSG